MVSRLHGIHRRPAAKAALRRLLQRPFNTRPGGPDVVQVPGHGAYWVRKRPAPRKVGRFSWIWYDVSGRRAVQRADRGGWKKPLVLLPKVNPRGGQARSDLQVDLWSGGRFCTFYHRLVALCLLRCYWTHAGQLLARPLRVPPALWGQDNDGNYLYEVGRESLPRLQGRFPI